MRLQAALARVSFCGAFIALAVGTGACSSDTPAAATSAGSGTAQAGSAGTSTGGAPANAGTSSGGAGQAGMNGAGTTAGGHATTGGTGGNGSGGVTAGSANDGGGGRGGDAGQAGAGGDAEGPFKLTSPVITEGSMIDVKFRCTGDNVTPALDWTRGPSASLSYAVTQIHVGSQSVHWVLWDIPAATRMLPEHIAREALPATPAGTKQVKPNIDGATWYGYTGPCPGGANQSYTFSVYALDVATLPGITPESTSTAAIAAVKMHQLAVASITVMASK